MEEVVEGMEAPLIEFDEYGFTINHAAMGFRNVGSIFCAKLDSKETKPMKQLKSITLRALLEAQGNNFCPDFSYAIGRIYQYIWSHEFYCEDAALHDIEISYEQLRGLLNANFPAGRKFLIEHGFIREEKTYAVGQWFERGKEKYILSQPRTNEVVLISSNSGNRWSKMMAVDDAYHVAEEELRLLMDGSYFGEFRPIPNPLDPHVETATEMV